MDEAQLRRPAEAPVAETLEAELERIAALGLVDLRSLWLKMTHKNAPRVFSRDLLARMIAYRVQEQQLGKLGREMRRRLDWLARSGGEPVRHLKVGTVMVREHKGTLHEVMVVPGGFGWRDKTYPSLSSIALAITGTSWNGPRFFGLRGGRSGIEAPAAEPPAEKDPPRVSTRASVRSIGAAAVLPREDGGAEALQDVYVKIWERAGDFDEARGSPMAWMATIARNRALDEVRRVRSVSLELFSTEFEFVGEVVDPLAARDRSQQLRALIDCLNKLDEEKRTMLMLAYYHGASIPGGSGDRCRQ
jgi:RNA polymerase sigma factor (sigma-70 family)